MHSRVYVCHKTLNLFISRCCFAVVPKCETHVMQVIVLQVRTYCSTLHLRCAHWPNYCRKFSRPFLKPLPTGSLCKLWEHRFSVPGLVSPPPPPPLVLVFRQMQQGLYLKVIAQLSSIQPVHGLGCGFVSHWNSGGSVCSPILKTCWKTWLFYLK